MVREIIIQVYEEDIQQEIYKSVTKICNYLINDLITFQHRDICSFYLIVISNF